MRSLDDLVGSGLACIAPLVTMARPRAIVAANAAVLEAARKDLFGLWQGKLVLAPGGGRELYSTIESLV